MESEHLGTSGTKWIFEENTFPPDQGRLGNWYLDVVTPTGTIAAYVVYFFGESDMPENPEKIEDDSQPEDENEDPDKDLSDFTGHEDDSSQTDTASFDDGPPNLVWDSDFPVDSLSGEPVAASVKEDPGDDLERAYQKHLDEVTCRIQAICVVQEATVSGVKDGYRKLYKDMAETIHPVARRMCQRVNKAAKASRDEVSERAYDSFLKQNTIKNEDK